MHTYKHDQHTVWITIPVTREQIEEAGVEIRLYHRYREWSDPVVEILVLHSLLGVRFPHIKLMGLVTREDMPPYRDILSKQVDGNEDMRAHNYALCRLAEIAVGKDEFAEIIARAKEDIPCWTDR